MSAAVALALPIAEAGEAMDVSNIDDIPDAVLVQQALTGQDLQRLDSGFEMVSNPPSLWPSFLVGQKNKPVRVAVVDDDIHFARVLQQELTQDQRLQLVGNAQGFKKGKRMVRSVEIDVLLLDLEMADGSGYQLLDFLRTHQPRCLAIVCTNQEDELYMRQAFDQGVAGYLLKNSWFGSFAQSVLQVANGGAALSPQLAKRLLQPHCFELAVSGDESRPAMSAMSEPLSLRETEILRMVAEGSTSLVIADRLQISQMTVNTHIRNTNRKLQVRSRAHAVQSAMMRGLI